jgi:3-hydroxymyristoyl/3-hydroxydecanoyl-(acyl carrier protein) dehydratase
MVTAYNMKLRQTPYYESHFIEEPTLPGNPFSADLATVDKIENSSQYWQSQHWY